MKNIKINNVKKIFLLGLILITSVNCQRNLSDDATLSTYSKNGDVFIDGFSAGLGYGAFGGSKYTAFTVDKEVKYEGTASMRFDVPSYGDPSGAYAGGVYIDGSGRNLTDFDAITFWVKGSQAASLNSIGFGVDFGLNKYRVEMSNVSIETNWQKVTIPIPDASKLIQEKGLFWYSEGPENNLGYTFWIDNLKYEKLGTIAHANPAIMGGVDANQQSFIGSSITLSGLTDTFNMASGINQTISVAPSYYTFTSSNTSVATVSELGVVTIVGSGSSVIKASLGGVQAQGSLTVNSLGAFTAAPIPTKPASNVISIYSDTYTNVPVNYTNGYWAPYQTTTSADFAVNGNNVLNYQNFNFVGIEFSSPTVNANAMTFLHLDVFVPNSISPTASFKVKIVDFGADGAYGGSGSNADLTSGVVSFAGSSFVPGTWKSIDINLTSFTGLPNKSHVAQIVFDSTIANVSSISNVYVDNIYFYN
ncbi:MAG: glycosyl hydrolase family 16 [Flavobacterium sp.]